MASVRDDPSSPDARFAEVYAQLPDATDLWPWLELAQTAASPVLYLGIGTGRLAVPLHAAGIDMVGVDSFAGCGCGSPIRSWSNRASSRSGSNDASAS